MIRGAVWSSVRRMTRVTLVALLALAWSVPAVAQPKKGSWEVFIYFGSFLENDIPSATQFGDVRTYRVSPEIYNGQRGSASNPPASPSNPSDVFRPNLGLVGGDQSGDPQNYPFNTDSASQSIAPPCSLLTGGGGFGALNPSGDSRAPYFDECDDDVETRWLYNASGIETNGEVQRDTSEFMLGLRGGYNITRHWEVEVDIGFGKQRIDLTQNLDPLLTTSTNDVSNTALANKLARFYEFTWANFDYPFLYSINDFIATAADFEHPAVIASRRANDSTFDIPVYFPVQTQGDKSLVPGETFDDVTGFINRIFQDPTAFRNRGNQINIDQFTLSGSVNYNFNTKADARVVPYVSAGLGQLFRNFDSPYDGDDSTFYTYGGGVRFFVNEIFSFRADARVIDYAEDSFLIEAALRNFNIPDRVTQFGGGTCFRDNREIRPPCATFIVPGTTFFPNLNGGGGNATIEVEAAQDDYYEIRIGFDVILGGK